MDVSFPVDSITTGITLRDKQMLQTTLRKELSPVVRFSAATDCSPSEEHFKLEGGLTINGITHPNAVNLTIFEAENEFSVEGQSIIQLSQ